MERYPFSFDPSRPFVEQARDWIADVFYDILPAVGFEIRDEQIYMAFQLERAYCEKQTIFAEAGVGTGKTLVYLLYAVCYARYTRKPAVIACASESLIEQLVKPEGDIAKLAQHLDFEIDVRLGKSPGNYLCLNKLDEVRSSDQEMAEVIQDVYATLPPFVHTYETLQTFYPYGERSSYPHLTDEQWKTIGWDTFQDCFVCEKRHRCGLTLSREHYRRAADLIICSHDFYMEHVWTYEGRKRAGQLSLLPSHSSVVFDEGHLLETAAQKALTYKIRHAEFEEIVTRLLNGEIRESLAVAVEEAIARSEDLFARLEKNSTYVAGSDRKEILFTEDLLALVNRFRIVIAHMEEEMALESGLFSLDEFQLRIVSEHLDMIQVALGLFQHLDEGIAWVTEDTDGLTLVIMPRMVKDVLKERVFSQKLPIVFSSATLSVDGSFDYVADSLGVENYLSFSVPSPYDYAQQMEVLVPHLRGTDTFSEKMRSAVRLLERTEGRALLLFPTTEEMKQFRLEISRYPECANMRFLVEGDQEISHLISSFQQDEHSCLCSVSLWEGLDVPGPSLMHVMIWSLPFPPNDPVYAAKRKAADDPYHEVDGPYMLLRMRQGMGRLIRSKEDRGLVTIFSPEIHQDEQLRKQVLAIMPEGVTWKESLS